MLSDDDKLKIRYLFTLCSSLLLRIHLELEGKKYNKSSRRSEHNNERELQTITESEWKHAKWIKQNE